MECKRTTDGRKFDRMAKEVLRMRVVQQINSGQSPEELARTLDINTRTVYRWMETYRKGGMEALKSKAITGRPRKLNSAQMVWLSDVLRQDPRRFGFSQDQWTGPLLRSLVARQFRVEISRVSASRIMRSLTSH